MTPRCLCCDRPLSPAACFDGWCETCAGRVLGEVLGLRDRKDVSIIVSLLCDWGCVGMAKAVVGVVPFDASET
jgi:hypothetical protein